MRLKDSELALDLGPGVDTIFCRSALRQMLVQGRAPSTDAGCRERHDVLVSPGELDVDSITLKTPEKLSAAPATPITFHALSFVLHRAFIEPCEEGATGSTARPVE